MVGDITIVRCSAKAVETTTMQKSWNKQENKINYTGKEKNAIFFQQGYFLNFNTWLCTDLTRSNYSTTLLAIGIFCALFCSTILMKGSKIFLLLLGNKMFH